MKLLYITNAINGSGGLERVLATKASYFVDDLSLNVTILTLNNGGTAPFFSFSEKIRFIDINVGGNPIAYFKSYKYGIKEAVKSVKPDIILVCDDGLKAFFIPKILKKYHVPIIYERHVSKLIELPPNANFKHKIIAGIKWKLMDLLAANFDAFVVLTNGNKKEWSNLNNVYVIPNPLPSISQITSDLTQKRIISVGKVCYQKGQDIMAGIWHELHESFPDWELHNFGKLEEGFLSSTSLPERMYLHPPTPNINEEYLKSSIYVLPSRYEGFGMVLIEAMNYGIPCIAFDCNYGPGDIISNNEDGILIPVGDIAEMRNQLKNMMNDVQYRKQLGNEAHINVERFNINVVANEWTKLFKLIKQ